MKMSIEKFLEYEKLFDLYFLNRNEILMSLIISSLIVCFTSIFFLHVKKKRIDYIDILSKIIIDISVIVGVGIILKSAGLKIEFEYKYMLILVFSFSCIVLFGIQIVEGIKFYRSWKEIIKKTGDILCRILLSTTLFLTLMGRLEVIEVLAIASVILLMKVLNMCLDSVEFKEPTTDARINCKYDIPIETVDNLFPTRKRQLSSFCGELKNIKACEPYAVMISAEWGAGKTSFINVLKDKIKNAEYIEVECGFEYKVESMLEDIEIQLQQIFKTNKIYAERNGAIENYFEYISDMIRGAGYKWVADIIKKLKANQNESYLEHKKKINQILEVFYSKTKRRIFIIVDNLDRIIKEEERYKIFQVVTETVGLKNCVTLFIADFNKFSSQRIDREFLEKYINHHLMLCNVDFEEIVSKYKENFLTNEFYKDKSKYIKSNSLKLREDIVDKGNNIFSKLTNEIKNIEKSLSEKLEDKELKNAQENLSLLKNATERLRIRMSNPRMVKRFLATIEKMLSVADWVWFQDKGYEKNELSNCDWVGKILQVAVLKTFLVEEYETMVIAKDLNIFKENYEKSYVTYYIIDGLTDISLDAIEEKLISLIVYKLYALDHNIDKTQYQRLQDEIDTDNMIEEHLERYLNECVIRDFNPNGLGKIVCYISEHTFYSKKIKITGVLNIMDMIAKGFMNHKEHFQIQKNMQILILQMKVDFSSKESSSIERYKEILQTRIIFQNSSKIKVLMELVHKINLESELGKNDVDSIDSLYDMINRINDISPIEDFVLKEDKLTSIQDYFNRIKSILEADEYKVIFNEINDIMLNNIQDMLTLLEIWFGKQADTNVLEINQLDLNKESIDGLYQWLMDLREYVHTDSNNTSKVGELFICVVKDIEEMMKSNMDWFSGKDGEIISVLQNMFDELSQSNLYFEKEYGDRWRFIKIRLFRMQRMEKK